MAYLQNKWRDYTRQPNPPRHYTNQREFEADWIYSLRRRYALSQEALAAMANVSVTTVQNWENPRSVKAIADHNQGRLHDIERDLWIKAHVTLLEPCPPTVKALYDLMSAGKDDSAQALAAYLVDSVGENHSERARLLHWASLTHSIADPESPKAREFGLQALDAVGRSDDRLSAAIENEILGFQMEDLLKLPAGNSRLQQGARVMAACERLHDKDNQPAYLWNALEVACRTPLPQGEVFRMVSRLMETLDGSVVERRIRTESAFEHARPVLTTTGSLN
jgi:transcriptional regulator with XRE-family HTH domain